VKCLGTALALPTAFATTFAITGSAESGGTHASLEAGGRLGIGVPLGNVDGLTVDTLGATVGLLFPLWLDMGVRIARRLYVGPYFAVGLGTTGDAINAGNTYCQSCYILDTRLGLNVHYHLRPNAEADPWFGLGSGYEWLQITTMARGASSSAGISGWEIVDAQLGVDFAMQPTVRIGPFASFSVAQYEPVAVYVYGVSKGFYYLPPAALHEWLMVGIRAVFDWPRL
jgi:hypothetical protein